MRPCASGLAFHWVFGASSPPTWIQRPFAEDVLLELDRRVRRIEDVLVHAPPRPHGNGVPRVAELGIRGDGGLGMARHLDLRHDRDEARARVGDDLTDVVLRVEAAVRLAVEPPRGRVMVLPAHERLTTPRPHLGESRVLLDLDPPSLVVRQVPVKAVELMERRQIDQLLHELLGHEMPRRVQMHAPPGEPGSIFDRDGGNDPRHAGHGCLTEDFRRQQLAQRLQGVKRARGPVGADGDARPADVQAVALLAQRPERRVEPDRDRRHAGRRRRPHGQPEARRWKQIIGEHRPERAARRVRRDHRRAGEREGPGLGREVRRAGDDGEPGVERERQRKRGQHQTPLPSRVRGPAGRCSSR